MSCKLYIGRLWVAAMWAVMQSDELRMASFVLVIG